MKTSHPCYHRKMRVRKGLGLGNLDGGMKQGEWRVGFAEAGDEWEASGTASPVLP